MTKDKPVQVHLVCGTDEYQVTTRTRECISELCPPERQALGLETIDAEVDNAAQAVEVIKRALEALRTMGLFGGEKVVWLKDMNFLAETQTGTAADTKAVLKQLGDEIKGRLPEGHHLVINAPKASRRSAFYKAVKAAGRIETFNVSEKSKQAEAGALGLAHQRFAEAGIDIDDNLLGQFIGRTGTDTRMLLAEADKLILYVGDERRVRQEDLEAIVSYSRDAMIWDLAAAVGERKLRQALQLVRQLLGQKQSHIGLIVTMENHFRLLLILRDCLDRGWVKVTTTGGWKKEPVWSQDRSADQILGALEKDPRKFHPFRVLKLLEQAALFSTKKLQQCRSAILRTHESMVRSQIPAGVLLELLVLTLIGEKQGARK